MSCTSVDTFLKGVIPAPCPSPTAALLLLLAAALPALLLLLLLLLAELPAEEVPTLLLLLEILAAVPLDSGKREVILNGGGGKVRGIVGKKLTLLRVVLLRVMFSDASASYL